MATDDVFGYIELSDPDAVPRDVLVHEFELHRRGDDLVSSMKLIGEGPSTPHIETLKSRSQEKRRAERRVLTKGSKAIEMETSIVADVPTTMEIPLYHFASDVESFLENPKVVKAADVLPKNSPLLTPRAVSGETVPFSLKAGVDGLTFSPARAKFSDFFVGPVGDKDHRVALHGFLAEPATLLIQGRGKVILQPGFEMISILKGTITPGFKPSGKLVVPVMPTEVPLPVKYASPAPNPTFFETQDPTSLGCGRHALNNLLGGLYFVKDTSEEITDANIQDLSIPISVMSVCKYLVTKKAVLGSTPCPENENYEDSVIMASLRIIGYTATPLILEEILDSSVGFIVNKNGDHWVAIRRTGADYTLIDSLEQSQPRAITLDNIKDLAKNGTYRSIMKVEYQGSFIQPVTESATEVSKTAPTPTSILDTLAAAITPTPDVPTFEPVVIPPRQFPAEKTDGLTPEEEEMVAQAETVTAPAPSTRGRSVATESMTQGAFERLAAPANVENPMRSRSPSPSPSPSILESIASVIAPAPAPAPSKNKCLKIEGIVDKEFSENIHKAIKEFITTSRPGLLTSANEKNAIENKNLNTYLEEILAANAGKAYTLLLPTSKGETIRTGSSHVYSTWSVPMSCSMDGDIIKVGITGGNKETGEAPTGNTFVESKTKTGGGVTEWTHFRFELSYV
jgi:hypothetical protein